MRLSRNERVIIFTILSMSLLTAMVNIVHVGFLIPVPGYTASMTADIEVRCSRLLPRFFDGKF